MGLLAAEMTAKTGKDPGEIYGDLTRNYGDPAYARFDASATPEQKKILAGMQEALFALRSTQIDAKPAYQDGDRIEKGQILLILTGNVADLLRGPAGTIRWSSSVGRRRRRVSTAAAASQSRTRVMRGASVRSSGRSRRARRWRRAR